MNVVVSFSFIPFIWIFPARYLTEAFTAQQIYVESNADSYLSFRNQHVSKLHNAPDKIERPTYDRRRATLGKTPIISRTIPIESLDHCTNLLEVTIWEMEKPSEIIQAWWSVDESDRATIGDPFGVVMWPGSIAASQELMIHASQVFDSTVFVLGAGTGVEAQVAALLGARKVIATDVNQFSLNLLDFATDQIMGAQHSMNTSISNIIETRCKFIFDTLLFQLCNTC